MVKMNREGCADGECHCTIHSTENIEVTGDGTDESPFSLTGIAGNTIVTSINTAGLQISVTGDGTEGDPYVVSAIFVPNEADRSASISYFIADGTWHKPATAQLVTATIVGGGGGGGRSGSLDPNDSDLKSTAGRGGPGGGITEVFLLADDLPDDVLVGVGKGAEGGVGTTGYVLNTPTTGGSSHFNNEYFAGSAYIQRRAPSGGNGAGRSGPFDKVPVSPSSGEGYLVTLIGGGQAGTTSSPDGKDGQKVPVTGALPTGPMPIEGAGGGGAFNPNKGGNGGDGGLGAGGGGGGAATTASGYGGSGGRGGDGVVIIKSW